MLKHGACPDCHEHFLQTYSGVASGSFTTPDHDYPSELELSLTATDARGLSNTTSVQLLPRTTTLSFATNPTGLKLTFNGATATAPFSRTVIVGSKNSVSAPSPQQLRGKQVFQSWSDGVTSPTHPRNHRAGKPGYVHRDVHQEVTDTGVAGPRGADGRECSVLHVSSGRSRTSAARQHPRPETAPSDLKPGTIEEAGTQTKHRFCGASFARTRRAHSRRPRSGG